MKKPTKEKKKMHYVDNVKLFEALVERRKLLDECKRNNKEAPQISNYIGKCIVDIASHLSLSPNFIGYSFRQDMIGDAIENCLKAVDKFNPELSKNPFAYFTQISWHAFLPRIAKEKKESYIKAKLLEQLPLEEVIDYQSDDGTVSNYIETLRENYYFDTAQYEKTLANKKNSTKKTKTKEKKQPLEKFMGPTE